MASQALQEFRKLAAERQAVISQNRSRRMRNLPALPVPLQPARPLVPIAYDAHGIYAGRLEDPEDLPAGCKLKWEEEVG